MATKPIFDDVRPFPTAPKAQGSVPGHNRPTPANDALREFNDFLAQRDGFADRCAALVAASDRASATDADTAGRCGELVKQITAAERVIEGAHKAAKEPYLEAGRAVDGAKKAALGPLSDAKAKVTGTLNVFVREEQERQRAEARRAEEARQAAWREEQERIAQERAANPEPAPVEEVAPPPPPAAPEPTRIRGDYGTLTSARTEWKSRVTDYEVAFIAAGLADNAKMQEVIDKVIQAQVKGGIRKIDGVHIFEETKAQVR